MEREIWIAGFYRKGSYPDTVWDLLGVFDTKEAAIKACTCMNCFVAPIPMNRTYPVDLITPFEGIEYPMGGHEIKE